MTTFGLTNERFSAALIGLADAPVDELDTDRLLDRLTRHFVEILGADASCAAVASPDGRPTHAGAHGPGGSVCAGRPSAR